ncbi:MAG: hypothetical protein JWM80_3398, partial [Cyanobacteria bacterium RYN_339]|nr:hypothetical protein [Cyanobacteria bacterium RYN_339]
MDAWLPRALDALARRIFRARWAVLLVVALLVAVSAWAGVGVERKLYGSVVQIPGTPSEHVATRLRTGFSGAFGELAVVAVTAPALTWEAPPFQAAVAAAAEALRRSPAVARVLTDDARLRSADGHTALILVGLTAPSAQEAEKATPLVRAAANPALE